MTTVRGVRNNNPGNIRKSKDKWQGLADSQPDPEFFTFKDPTWGIRAIARLLINYQDDYALNTIEGAISRWAPPNENNTNSYAKTVARRTGFGPQEPLNFHEYEYLFPVVKEIIYVECGAYPYSDEIIKRGLLLAGVLPPKAPVVKAPKVKAATVAAGLTGISAVADQVNQSVPAISALGTLAQYAPIAVAILAAAAVGWFIYQEVQRRKVGL